MAAASGTKQQFVVGFTVHEAQELSQDGVAIDPLVIVRALGCEYKTELKRGKLQRAKFEESHVWSGLMLTEGDFNSAFIEFELQSALVFFRNETVGTARVQLAMVRLRPNHTYVQKWLPLTNGVKKKGAKIKITVYCYGPGDDPPKKEDMEHDVEETAAHLQCLSAAVMGDTGGKKNDDFTQSYHLFIQVHRAEHLGGGEQLYNAYVSVEFNGHRLESPSSKETHTVNFDEAFRIPVTTPLFSDSVLIRVWNKQNWQSDEIIVQGRLSFSLLRMRALQPKWFNFYGFSNQEVEDITKLTGHGEMIEENAYQGRLLISGRVQKVPNGDLQRPALLKGPAFEEPPAISTTFLVDVFEVAGCPGSEAYVQMSLGKSSKKCKAAKRDPESDPDVQHPGRFVFTDDGRGRMKPLTAVVPTDPANQFDLLLSLYAKGVGDAPKKGGSSGRVGFVRVKIPSVREWRGETAAPQWISCRPMAHLPSSVEPGAILISLQKSTTVVTERSMPSVKPLSFELRCYICMARGLVSQSSTVPSSFCQVSCAGKTEKTGTIQNTTAPCWAECLRLPIQLQCSLNTMRVYPEPVQVVVYDEVDTSPKVLDMMKGAIKSATSTGGEADAGDVFEKLEEGVAQTAEKTDDQGVWAKMGMETLQIMRDKVGDLRGDVMARKRLGAVVNGRRVIGRAQVNFRHLLHPSTGDRLMKPKWVKIKGGMMGSHHVGDILFGFELMRSKYSKNFDVKPTKPEGRDCTLSVSVLGLRNIAPITGTAVSKPKLQIAVPSFSGASTTHMLEWKKNPEGMGEADYNRKWSMNGCVGFEFFNTAHLDVVLPRFPVWEPDLRFRLFDEKDNFLAEGRVSLAEEIPWVKPAKAREAVEAKDEYVDSDAEVHEDGVPVSDAEDDDGGKTYVNIKVGEEPIGVAFSKDTKRFPPEVTEVAANTEAHKKGIKAGDWLIGYRRPEDPGDKPTGHWNSFQASAFIEEMNQRNVRPLQLNFRQQDKAEVSVRLQPKTDAGLVLLEDDETKPPEVESDDSASQMWKEAGVEPGWRIIDINGFDITNLTAMNPKFKKLLSMRPIIVTCRPQIAVANKKNEEEKDSQQGKPVLLSGMAAKILKVLEDKMYHKDGCLAGMCTPRPSMVLPPVTDTKCLNLRMARNSCIDVRGMVKYHAGGGGEDGDDRSRPSVSGRLEDMLEPPPFHRIILRSGPEEVGIVKAIYKAVNPRDAEWMNDKKKSNDMENVMFNEKKFRHKFKAEQPPSVRVRSYVVRGLNIVGADGGHGNPYLFFIYGQDRLFLEGYRQLNTGEPRFFRTEERDIKMPDQALVEVGLFDWRDGGEDQLIGKTVIDLEDRWYMAGFQDYMKKNNVPIEYRPIMDSTGPGALCKGSLEMWLEILDSTTAAEVPLNALFQPPAVEVEIRVVLWTVRNLSLRLCVDDYGEERDMIDILVRCTIDCKTYVGPQPVTQETDVHHGSEGDGEFNWRFIFSRVSVMKGVPLDCVLQLSIWEHFALKRPEMMCENLIQMKNYCVKVAMQKEFIEIEAELPLTNQKLAQTLAKERQEQAGGGDEEGDESSEDSDDNGEPALEREGQEESQEALPPAALMKVMVQVVSQTEATGEERKVGLGRNEPNRNPVLTYPKTGRSWQYALPTAAKAVEFVIEGFSGGKRRCGGLMILVVIIGVVVGLHFPKGPNGCPFIQRSCTSSSTCPACACCHHTQNVDKAVFCYYSFLSPDRACAVPRMKDFCNMASDCNLGDAGTCLDDPAEGICYREPMRGPSAIAVPASGR